MAKNNSLDNPVDAINRIGGRVTSTFGGLVVRNVIKGRDKKGDFIRAASGRKSQTVYLKDIGRVIMPSDLQDAILLATPR